MLLFTFGLIILLIGLLFAAVGKYLDDNMPVLVPKVVGSAVAVIGFVMVVVSTAIYVNDNQGGVVIVKFGSNLPPGQIIATNGEKGPQAKVLSPGWHFFYWPWLYTLESVDNMEIPEGSVGVVLAKDGADLPVGEVYAKAWDSPKDMLDAEKFLKEGGQRGPQLTVLPPAQYRYNPRLFDIQVKSALTVKVGEVVVIKANAGEKYDGKDVEMVNGVPIVPNGYRGIWKEALTPNKYYMHPDAYETIPVRTINRIYSYTSPSQLNKADRPESDNSIGVRTMDGFEFPVDVRVSAKISAENAPYAAARLANPDADPGNDGFDTLEEIVILPAVRAIFRNSAETRSALEYVGTRSTIEKTSTEQFAAKLKEFKVDTDGIFIADIGLSKTPEGQELLKTQTDKEVADQEQAMWQMKKLAQVARAESVKAETEADKEKDKVEAKVKIEIAKDTAQATIEEATGEAKAAEMKIAAVGGFTNYVILEGVKAVAEKWSGNIPNVLVNGEGGGIDTAVLAKMLETVNVEANAKGKIGVEKVSK